MLTQFYTVFYCNCHIRYLTPPPLPPTTLLPASVADPGCFSWIPNPKFYTSKIQRKKKMKKNQKFLPVQLNKPARGGHNCTKLKTI